MSLDVFRSIVSFVVHVVLMCWMTFEGVVMKRLS